MAIPSFALVQILRESAERLAGGADYQWSHFGKCNCGHVAQTATRLSAAEIHRTAHRKLSEWSEVPDDFCPQTGVLIDRVIDTLFELGLNNKDLCCLEDLTGPEVLKHLPEHSRNLQRNQRADVVLYLRAWADVLEAQLPLTALVDDLPAPPNGLRNAAPAGRREAAPSPSSHVGGSVRPAGQRRR